MPRIQLKLMGALALLVVAVLAAVGGLAERGLRSRELARIEQGLADIRPLAIEDCGGSRAGWRRHVSGHHTRVVDRVAV